MTEFRDQDFNGQEVLLSGNTFTGCTFQNCRVVYEALGGPFGLGACHFKENVEWAFDGAAARTIKLLSSLYTDQGDGGRKLVEHLLKHGLHAL